MDDYDNLSVLLAELQTSQSHMLCVQPIGINWDSLKGDNNGRSLSSLEHNGYKKIGIGHCQYIQKIKPKIYIYIFTSDSIYSLINAKKIYRNI